PRPRYLGRRLARPGRAGSPRRTARAASAVPAPALRHEPSGPRKPVLRCVRRSVRGVVWRAQYRVPPKLPKASETAEWETGTEPAPPCPRRWLSAAVLRGQGSAGQSPRYVLRLSPSL